MATDKKYVDSMFEYVKCMEEVQTKKNSDEIVLFRGHAKEDYKLKPSLFRCDNKEIRAREAEAIRRIEILHPRELAGMSTLDKLVMLQHYEFPTRLLDFSLNPLVGLFFAANSHKKDNGTVIICRVAKDAIKPFDSIITQALATLAIFPQDLKQGLSQCDKDMLPKALKQFPNRRGAAYMMENKQCDKYISELAGKFVKYLPEGVSGALDLFTPVFVETKLLNPRIVAQKGAFLLFGLDDEFPESIQREEIIIPSTYKAGIITELEQFGIDESIMFPDFEHFLLYLREKMKRSE